MYLTTDGAVTTLTRDLAVLPDRHRPAGPVRPQPALHRPDRAGRQQPEPLGRRRPVRVGRHQVLGHRLHGSDGCDWKAGLRHRRRAPGHGARRQRQCDLRRLVRPVQPADGFDRGLATNYGGPGTSSPSRAPEPLHHLDRSRPRQPGTRLRQRRLLQPPLDPRRRCRARLRVDERRRLVDRHQRQPARCTGLQGGDRRGHTSSSAPRSAPSSPSQRGGSPLRWSQLGKGLPNVTVWDLTVTPDGSIAAGTHGRGDWKITLK